ncbi:MAG: hypothetical protein AB1758_06525, partial [Candidatus Eremiobacterota bacterium]
MRIPDHPQVYLARREVALQSLGEMEQALPLHGEAAEIGSEALHLLAEREETREAAHVALAGFEEATSSRFQSDVARRALEAIAGSTSPIELVRHLASTENYMFYSREGRHALYAMMSVLASLLPRDAADELERMMDRLDRTLGQEPLKDQKLVLESLERLQGIQTDYESTLSLRDALAEHPR